MNKKIAAILPIKGHSERVPNKNMRDFNGKPLYHWILTTLFSCDNIDVIIIDTDSEIIKRDVKENFSKYINNIIINDRPEYLIGDYVPMNDIIKNIIENYKFDYYVQTHSTNPLLSKNTIDEIVSDYLNNDNVYDSGMGVTAIYARCYKHDGTPINHDRNNMQRTQDLKPIYEENSTLFIFSEESFLKSGNNRVGLKCKMYEINKMESVDIDTEEDFKIAEILHGELQ